MNVHGLMFPGDHSPAALLTDSSCVRRLLQLNPSRSNQFSRRLLQLNPSRSYKFIHRLLEQNPSTPRKFPYRLLEQNFSMSLKFSHIFGEKAFKLQSGLYFSRSNSIRLVCSYDAGGQRIGGSERGRQKGEDGIFPEIVEEYEEITVPRRRVAIFWDLDNKPPNRVPAYDAALRLKGLAGEFGEVVDMVAYANQNAFTYVPPRIREERQDRRMLDQLKKRGVGSQRVRKGDDEVETLERSLGRIGFVDEEHALLLLKLV